MNDSDAQSVALFRFDVIAPLLSVTVAKGSLKKEIKRLAQKPHQHPTRGSIKVGAGTIREWLYKYKHLGLDGLLPASRGDQGKSRAIDDELGNFIEELALSQPSLDGPALLAELKCQIAGERLPPSLSSLYRFLRAKGLDQRGAPRRKDHRAYAFDLAGECWQGDVMYGPRLPTKDGSRRKTYLIAIIDDATRLIPYAQFYYEQHLRSLKDCLKQALLRRGVPRRFYFDNGRIFKSRMLLALAARLGIQLIHSKPYQPQGRAKIERWFGTVRRGFLARLDLDRLDDIDELNRLLWAWVEAEYHQRGHRSLGGETPLDCWLRLSEGIRPPPQNVDLDQLFFEETTRRVAKDGTITLKGKVFEAGPCFIGERVKVRFDLCDLRRVIVFAEGREPEQAFPVDLRANRFVKRRREEVPETRPDHPLRALEELASELEQASDADEKESTTETGGQEEKENDDDGK